jgi:DNA-binding transcriptional LysR family regulator
MVLICTVCLGDDPPRDRTAQLRALGFPSRHLGPVQMTTDTALGVTKMVVQDKGFLFCPSLTRSRTHLNPLLSLVPLAEIPYIVRFYIFWRIGYFVIQEGSCNV